MFSSHKSRHTNVSECLNLQSLYPVTCEFYLYIFVLINRILQTPSLVELFATGDENVIFVFLLVKGS